MLNHRRLRVSMGRIVEKAEYGVTQEAKERTCHEEKNEETVPGSERRYLLGEPPPGNRRRSTMP